jgi:hypothetical protein
MSEHVIKLTPAEWEQWLELTRKCEERKKKNKGKNS